MPLAPRGLTLMHRRQQLALRKSTVAQVEALWPALDWADLDRSFPGFAGETLALVSKNRRTSAGLAAAYLRAFRIASGLSGDVRIVVPQMPSEQFETSLRVTSVVAAKRAAAAGAQADVAMSNALTQATGAMARLVLNAGRDTLLQSLRGDPMARGWSESWVAAAATSAGCSPVASTPPRTPVSTRTTTAAAPPNPRTDPTSSLRREGG